MLSLLLNLTCSWKFLHRVLVLEHFERYISAEINAFALNHTHELWQWRNPSRGFREWIEYGQPSWWSLVSEYKWFEISPRSLFCANVATTNHWQHAWEEKRRQTTNVSHGKTTTALFYCDPAKCKHKQWNEHCKHFNKHYSVQQHIRTRERKDELLTCWSRKNNNNKINIYLTDLNPLKCICWVYKMRMNVYLCKRHNFCENKYLLLLKRWKIVANYILARQINICCTLVADWIS
jgi:hypothetical protein